jgi:hypothetical protein
MAIRTYGTAGEGLRCNNINSPPMGKRLFDNSIYRFPHSHVAEQAYGVFVLPACELPRVIGLGPAHGRDFVPVRGDRADHGTTQMARRSEYLWGIRRMRGEEGVLVGRVQSSLLALEGSRRLAGHTLPVALCPSSAMALNLADHAASDPPSCSAALAGICRPAAKWTSGEVERQPR